MSELASVRNGIPLILYIDDLPDQVKSSEITLYIDASKLYTNIKPTKTVSRWRVMSP